MEELRELSVALSLPEQLQAFRTCTWNSLQPPGYFLTTPRMSEYQNIDIVVIFMYSNLKFIFIPLALELLRYPQQA